jgi:hypothetical protein
LEYLTILRRLARLLQDQCDKVAERQNEHVSARIIFAFLAKTRNTLRAIILLYQNNLEHEAQSQIRVIFELRVTFDAFISLLQKDIRSACNRVLDAITLQKVKQARASDFLGLDLIPGAPTAETLEKNEAEIKAKYSDKEARALQINGFSGVSVEQRAIDAGLMQQYNIIYRNFSRNVHSADFMELFLANDISLRKEWYKSYIDIRNNAACDVAYESALGIATSVDTIFRLKMGRRIRAIIRAHEMLNRSIENQA